MKCASEVQSDDSRRSGGTRAITVGALCALFVSVAFPYANLVLRGSRPANTSLPFGVVAICFVVAALGPLLRRVHHRLSLSRDDLLVVYLMVLIAAAVPTWGLIGQLLPIMTGAQYYATPENRWEDLLLPQVSPWMTPASPEVARQFYEGLPPGGRIPWGAWALPLTAWSVMAGAFYAATLGVMLLLRRQWVDRERLIYPLMRLPLALADTEKPGTLPSILREPMLWVGVSLVLIPTIVNGLHFYIPSVPFIKLRHSFAIPIQRETLMLYLWTNFAVVGFSYVVSADLGFTLWFFALVAALQTPLMRLAGVSLGGKEIYCAGSPAVSNQAMGAMIFLVIAGLWAARAPLRESWLATWGQSPKTATGEDEATHSRTAVLLTLCGLFMMGAWLVASGVPMLPTVVFLGAAFVNFIALTRATLQGGVPVTRAALIPQSFTAYALGSPAMGPKGIAGLGYAFAWTADIRVIMMTFFGHALKLWSELRPRRRGLLLMAGLAIVIGAVGGTLTTLYFAYTRGGVSLSSWLFQGNPTSAFKYAAALIQTPAEPNFARFAYLAIGAGAMGTLTYLHRSFMWWPLHPLGFAVAATQPVQDLWFSILIGWCLKACTMRYGGYRSHRRLLPLLLGLVLGQSLGCAGWLVADAILGKTGNIIFVY